MEVWLDGREDRMLKVTDREVLWIKECAMRVRGERCEGESGTGVPCHKGNRKGRVCRDRDSGANVVSGVDGQGEALS